MQVCLLKSKKDARFHFGESLYAGAKEEYNNLQTVSHFLHADTLFSAIVSAWALTNPETVEDFIVICKRGDFKISSAFYCVETKQKTVFFLPKPVSLNLFHFNEPEKLKQIQMISTGIWEKGLLPHDWFDTKKCTLLQNQTIVALAEEIDQDMLLYDVVTAPKTKVRAPETKENFYFQTDLHLLGNKQNAVHWYFLIEKPLEGALEKHLIAALQTLTNLGIGGNRSSGCGSLQGFEFKNFSLNMSNTLYRAGISQVIPNENELTDHCFYLTMKRGGRCLEYEKKLPTVQVLQEGAVFDKEIKGQVISLNENPPILRYGMNVTLPLHNNFVNGLL
jgi:CRISPR-associated protein Csm4